MQKLTKEDEMALLKFLKYFVSSFIEPSELSEKQKLSLIKAFLYKRSREEIQNAIARGKSIK
ncbi:MAG: hypothetical protein QXV17_05410 [Candidatus Micrarchaeaceae archaeon]